MSARNSFGMQLLPPAWAAQPDSERFRSRPRTLKATLDRATSRPTMGHAGNLAALTRGAEKLEDGTMSTSDGVQKRNAFAACAAFRIERLEASLNQAREIAAQEELDAVGRYIEEAQGYLAQIQVLHQEALEEFSGAQGE